jgi:cytochrome c oxidase cbb3-type subunit 3/ubiquinol-cytochrome c reductase cytochrome c subunit
MIIAGQPEQGMPDWRSDAIGANSRPISDEEITNIVAWIATHRIAAPGQPYPQKP